MPVQRIEHLDGPALAFVTTTIVDWNPLLAPPAHATEVTLQIAETMMFYGVSVVGYVVMPSHVHMLLGFPEISQLSRAMQSFKGLSSRRLKGMYSEGTPQIGPIWKRRFDDLIVTSALQFQRKLDYIHDNPVKAGVARNAIDWQFSSARDWLLGERGLIDIDKNCDWIKS